MLFILEDTVGRNHVLFPRCSVYLYESAYGYDAQTNCQDIQAEAPREYGLTPDDVHDSFRNPVIKVERALSRDPAYLPEFANVPIVVEDLPVPLSAAAYAQLRAVKPPRSPCTRTAGRSAAAIGIKNLAIKKRGHRLFLEQRTNFGASTPAAGRPATGVPSVPAAVSQRLQEFDQIGFLCGGEIQPEALVIVIDHREKIGRTAIMKIWRMLPEAA